MKIQITYLLFALITAIQTNMLLVIFLCLIVKLASVSGDCEFGTAKLINFDWSKVGICVLTILMYQSALECALGSRFHFRSVNTLAIGHVRL
jgi:hypothetical protein